MIKAKEVLVKFVNNVKSKINMKYLKNLGRVLSILAVGFIIYTIYTMVGKLDHTFFSVKLILPVLIAIIIFCSCNYIYAFSYKNILENVCGINIPYLNIAEMYLNANIYKYLPSNMMHYVGRNVLAQKYNIPQKRVAQASVYEILNVIVVTLIYCLACISYRYSFMLAILIYAIIIFLFRKKYILKSFLLISVTTAVNNLIVVYFYNIYTSTSLGKEFIYISVLQSLSWLAGFVMPGAPGGIGVKEFVMIKLGSKNLVEVLTVVAVLQRIILIFGDILAFFSMKGIVAIMHRVVKKKSI